MKTLKRVPITPVYVELMPEILDQGVLYISKECGVAIHLCLCGCGIETVTPFGIPSGWDLIEKGGTVSLHPSIGNYQFPCKSHYIITNNIANFV